MSSRYVPADNVVSRVVGEETVLVDLDSELYYSLNPTGSVLWTEVSAGRSLDGVVDTMVARFGVAAERARVDSEELIAELVDAGLLVPA